MKKLAKLTLFFSISFVIVLIITILLRLLSSWIDLVRIIPLGELLIDNATEAAWKAFPATLYLTILLVLSYTARRNIPVPLTIIVVIILGCVFTAGTSIGISRVEAQKPALEPVSPIQGRPGLILSRSDNAMIILRESRDVRGPRVVSIPGRPLIYQAVPLGPNNTILNLPALSFGENTPWFIRSVSIDFSLSSAEMKSRLENDYISFAVYVFSLILCLGSLRIILELSKWPLANLFIGVVVFRGILSLEIFLNTREMNELIASFLDGRLPPMLITPAVFGALGILIIFYSLMARIARPRRTDD